jgi:membrane-associated phospholipid phosphatase
VHYLTDTIAGYCVAIATVLAIALVLDHWRQWGITRKGGDGGLAG